MEEQYESGYMCINDIEDYSDQALQEIAKQICARVRKEFYFQIRFKQDITALLADIVMHHVTRSYIAFMNEQWRLDVTVLLPFSERPEGLGVTFTLAGDSEHVTTGPVHELTLLTRGPGPTVTALNSYHVHAFSEICLGGTFDRLHVGHKVLLTAGLILAVTRVIVGLTGDVLLKNKKHRELIQPFTERSLHVTQFMKHVKPHEALLVAELTEPAGPSATEPNAACLVATQETASALDSINQIRQSKGLQPLVSYVLGMLPPPKELAQYDSKISSTTLRALDQGK